MFVTITRRPVGEAPEWVRDAWVGVRLPVSNSKQQSWPTFGVFTGPHGALKQLAFWLLGRANQIAGFPVDANAAVDLLTLTNPAAADWWRSNAPHLLAKKRVLVFDRGACAVDEG